MSYVNPIFVEEQRRRWLRPDWQRWMRPDWRRWMGEDAHCLPPPSVAETKSQHADADFADELDAIRADHERVRQMLAEVKYELAWRRFVRKYSPDQPRVPAGNSDGGQWTGVGGQPAKSIRLAGDVPTNGAPKIPDRRPPSTKGRNDIYKKIARYMRGLARRFETIVRVGSWAYEGYSLVKAYQDPPKTLDELREAVSAPARGYDIHHIVEQTPAEQDGYPRSQIDSPENKVRIPTLKHWEISGWYQTKNEYYGDRSPREFLRDKDWNTRTEVGVDALTKFGVLKR